MLSINFYNVDEEVEVGALFAELDVNSEDETQDFFIENQFNIEVLSLDSYYSIEGFRLTKTEKLVKFIVDGFELEASPEHVVLTDKGWLKICDIDIKNTKVLTVKGLRNIIAISKIENEERLYDLQVKMAHSYFTNGILSHNSHFLVQCGANALKLGKNVLHYTFEMSENAVGLRYDSNFCSIDSNEVIENKNKVLNFYEANKKNMGSLRIKQFPTRTATINLLRAHMERLDVNGFRPDVLILDYADLMRSSRQYESPRHEINLLYEELRGLAMELQIPVVTASQSNKEGVNSDVIDITNMSEAYAKAFTCDIVLSLSRKTAEKASGYGRLFVAKNRAGRDGICHNIKINTAQSKFEIIGEVSTFEETSQEEARAQKAKLAAKWKELQSEIPLQPAASTDSENVQISIEEVQGIAV